MEKRWVKLNLVTSGSGTRNYRVNLPTGWVKDMLMSDEKRDVKIMYDEDKKQIIIEAFDLMRLADFAKKIIEKYAGELGILVLKEGNKYPTFEKAELEQIQELLDTKSITEVLRDLRINRWDKEKNYISIFDVAIEEFRQYVEEYLVGHKAMDKGRNFKEEFISGRDSLINVKIGIGIEKGYDSMLAAIEHEAVETLENYKLRLGKCLKLNNQPV